jgi:hypothetical protein
VLLKEMEMKMVLAAHLFNYVTKSRQ